MCLSELKNRHTMPLKLLLIILVLYSKLISCDILINSTRTENFTSPLVQCNSENSSDCNKIMRDRHVVIVKQIDNYLSEASSKYSTYNDRLKYSSILYGIVLLAQENELNQKCYNEIMQIYDGIGRKETWAIKTLDSSGRFESGFLLGNNHWLGSQRGCDSVKSPLYVTLSNRFERLMKSDLIRSTAPFEMDYRIVYAKHYSPWQIEIKFQTENLLHIGLCMPKSCTNDEIHNLTQEYLNSRTLDAQNLFEFESDVLLVKDLKLREDFFSKTSVIILCVVLSIILIVVLCAYIRDERINESTDPIEAAQCHNFWDKLLKSFSIQSNWRSLMDDTTTPNSINVINGIKSISCFLILCFHVFWFSFYAVKNSGVLFHFSEQVRFQWISNAALMVDSFFCISGFLVTYNFLRSEKQMTEIKSNSLMQNLKLFGRLLLHRFIRLSPLYLMVGLLTEIFTSYLVDVSKFWVHERTDLNCQRFWWRNILYIHNLFDHDELCMNWTWSMACEMQFFVFFTIILFIYAKRESLGKISFTLFTILMFFVGWTRHLKYKFLPSFDVLLFTGTELYISPWTRIIPYAVGVGCGWYLHQNRKTFSISDISRNFMFFLSTFSLLLALHATIQRDIEVSTASVCMLIGRPLIALAVSWFIITNACGYNCIVSKIFSAKFFVRINKLTYAIYLLNPLVISMIFGNIQNGTFVDPVLHLVLIIGITLLTYVLAIVFSLLFEIPFYKLSNEILRGATTNTSIASPKGLKDKSL
ncbi:hypothetical protein PVAND_006783 [Polypedilum vanderplanki]|uniref:Nose resistant-to-fluoxetine protein N-terminal domain-containing protein n=1 Tax=Polypedilum vanderplanki TaxID=319348 RepID=A0A9J6C564_POLVA|nr:hypothetical protein PVAND_006783 [Polypedilum vanderplanki]